MVICYAISANWCICTTCGNTNPRNWVLSIDSYTLVRISAKNYQNRLMCIVAIVWYVSAVFLRHSVCTSRSIKQEAFEKCWAQSLLRAVLHCHSPGVATAATVARRLGIDVHDNDDDDDDNEWQTGPLWLHGMGPISCICIKKAQHRAILTSTKEFLCKQDKHLRSSINCSNIIWQAKPIVAEGTNTNNWCTCQCCSPNCESCNKMTSYVTTNRKHSRCWDSVTSELLDTAEVLNSTYSPSPIGLPQSTEDNKILWSQSALACS